MAPHPEGLRWYQIPLSSARVPRSVIFSYGFQAGLQRYQQLRALKHLRVGRPIAPPPPGLLEPCPPAPPPADSPPRASHAHGVPVGREVSVVLPRGVGVTGALTLLLVLQCPEDDPSHPPVVLMALSLRPKVASMLPPRPSPCPQGAPTPRRRKDSPGTRKRVSRSRQPPGPAPPRAILRDAAKRGSPPCQATPDAATRVPVLPVGATGSLGGDATRGQHAAAGTVPQQAGGRAGGRPLGTATGWVSSTDSEDDDLIPLRDMLTAGDEPPSPADHQQVACPRPDPLANSLESLVQEKREQSQAATLRPGLAWAHEDDDSPWESLEEDMELSEDNRDFLAHHTMTPRLIPTVHPGEPVFCAHPAPVPTLDTRGLTPQSALEGFFLCNSPACQAAFVREGGLSLLYRCVPTCPLPVLRWLFQLMTLCPDTTNASQVLWEIWLSAGGEPWCPTVQEISGAFARLGADLSPLCHQRLLPPEFCPTERRSLDPSFSSKATPDATNTLALVTQLGDICKFLALCVVTQPCRYPDGARLSLVTLLCFLGLDRALRCHPLPELQHLVHCLLEGIRDWQGQLPSLCQSLSQLSGHHHNLVALVRLLPDLTKRDRELRRCLSLHAMARLLGEPPATVPPPGAQAEMEVLGRLLALARPDALRRLVATHDGQEKPENLDQEACYLSYSLLLLASNVVGTENPPPQQRGYLERLCGQLDQHFGRGLHESPCLLFRSQLKSLAALLFVKWQEMLA